ncbi:MAG: hypothetical protein E4G91_09780, partial [Candidatus Zixiibacteriota bacterium]
MIVVALLVAIGLAYYLSYLLSITAGGLYLSDYEESKFINSLPAHKRDYLQQLLKNPKRVAATADIVLSAALIVSTVCWFVLGRYLQLTAVNRYVLQIVLLLAGWFI